MNCSSAAFVATAILCAAVFLLSGPHSAQAEITLSGDVWPTNAVSWSGHGSGGSGYIGRLGAGALTIDNGSTASSRDATLGSQIGSSGDVTVDGSGSTWTIENRLYVGASGDGNLNITNGGRVSGRDSLIGAASESTGQVTVDGSASTWTIENQLDVGAYGEGYLNITNNGRVSSKYSSIGLHSGSIGQVTVDGSIWESRYELLVGESGNGSLNILNDGIVRSVGTVWVAQNTGSTGSIHFDNGTLLSNALISVSDDLTGTGTINTGSLFTDIELVFDATHGLEQTILLNGPGQNITINMDVGQDSISNNVFGAGYATEGSLSIADGVTIQSRNGYIGYKPGAVGHVSVDGPGSTWQSGFNLSVGHDGSGTLDITDGGLVHAREVWVARNPGSSGAINFDNGTLSTSSLFSALENLTGTGIINASGVVSDLDLVFDATHGLSQAILLDGPGQNITLQLHPSQYGSLGAGFATAGTLRIADGIEVQSDTGYVGYLAGSTGQITVDGAGSAWTIRKNLSVRNGSLSITRGGTVSSDTGTIGSGLDANSTGHVTIDGEGSAWIINDSGFYLVRGTLGITNGGILTSQGGTISGQVTVDGLGSTWAARGSYRYPYDELLVGDDGSGSLTIMNGGQVSSSEATIGSGATDIGHGSVDGVDSVWMNFGSLTVGESGSGSLSITNGGAVNVTQEVWVAQNLGASGSIDFQNGTLTTRGLLTAAANLTGTGTINTNGLVTDIDLVFDANHGLVQALSLNGPGQNITIYLDVSDSTFSPAGSLGAGYAANGSMSISDGIAVQSLSGYLGYKAGSTGQVSVDGPDSTWTIGRQLLVGQGGSGTLSITNGGEVRSSSGQIGVELGSMGLVNVDGVGSIWETGSNGDLRIGQNGNGTLNITNGGTVTNIRFRAFIGSGTGATGEVFVDGLGSVWENQGDLAVGGDGSGLISITNGGTVRNARGSISSTSGITSQVIVDGAGSTWTSTLALTIGGRGNGTLSITGGGVVNSSDPSINLYYNTGSYLGVRSGSNGEVTVDGVGSTWTTGNSLVIGSSGNGTLNITNGGRVNVEQETWVARLSGSTGTIHFDNGTLTTGGLLTATDDLTGTGTINARSVVSDIDLVFDATHGLNQTFLLDGPGQNIILNLDIDSSGIMGAGYAARGLMRISDGILIQSKLGYLGYKAGSSGLAIVDGAGSAWTTEGTVYVGESGNGTLFISGGGAVRNLGASIGKNDGSSGQAIVQGSGSIWEMERSIYVGDSGNGTLTITGGGTVSNSGGFIGREKGSLGQVSVDGVGSSWTNSSVLYIGEFGSGTLNITRGGSVHNSYGFIGTNSRSVGKVTVDGAGSVWTNSGDLIIGQNGIGTLNITGGGSVNVAADTWVAQNPRSAGAIHFNHGTLTTGGLIAATADLTGTGTINTHGLVTDTDLVFDAAHGVNNHLLLNGPDQNITINVEVDGSGSLGIGYVASGTMRISDGIVVQSTNGYIGYKPGSTGQVTVDRLSSAWTNSGDLTVGSGGNAMLAITSGAQVSNGIGIIGSLSSSTSAVTVDGTGTAWTNSGDLTVGSGGNAMLAITSGAQVSNGIGIIGSLSSSTSAVTVDGPGSAWTNSSDLTIGRSGNGTLTITNGGVVHNRLGAIATLPGSTGHVVVDGAGSTWTNDVTGTPSTYRQKFIIGQSGHGSLAITNGGTVVNALLYRGTIIGDEQEATGELLIDGVGSTWSSDGNITVGNSGSGRVNISDGASVTSSSIWIGRERNSTGEVTISGADSTWTSTRSVNVGYFGDGTLTINNGATLHSAEGRPAATIGVHTGASGHIIVDGPGSTWTFGRGGLYVGGSLRSYGRGGSGTLTITNGATVGINGNSINYSSSYIGFSRGSNSAASGKITIDGAGSTLTLGRNLYIGRGGRGELQITNGGLVTVAGTLTVDFDLDNDSFINMSTGGMLALFGDADDSLEDFYSIIDGTDAIRYWDDAAADWADLTQATLGSDYTLEFQATGDLAGYTLLTVGTVPEPSTIVLLLTACGAIGLLRHLPTRK